MTVTAKTDEEKQPGRVACAGEIDQNFALLDENGHRITRFDNMLRDVHRAGRASVAVAEKLLAWQQDYRSLIWDNAMERVVLEMLDVFRGAVYAHQRDDLDPVSVEETHGTLDMLPDLPATRPLRGDTTAGPGTPFGCGCGQSTWPTR